MLEIVVSLSFMVFSLLLMLIIGLTLYTITVSIYPPLGDYVNEKIARAGRAIRVFLSK